MNKDEFANWLLHVETLLAKCKEMKLDLPGSFLKVGATALAKDYNGAGPEWMPDFSRDILTMLLDLFEPALLIHDFEFSNSDGTIESFHKANNRMWKNIWKIIRFTYPLWNPLCWVEHIFWFIKGRMTYNGCRLGAWQAWEDGHNARIALFEKVKPKPRAKKPAVKTKVKK